MKKLSVILFFLPLFSLSQIPSANFIWSPNPACVGLPVYFLDSSNTNFPISYWSWNFSDGTISTDQNPIHIFNLSGGYMVTLSIADPSWGVTDTTIWVPVNNCNTSSFSNTLDKNIKSKKLIKAVNILGKETDQTNQPLLYIYDDGTVEKRIVIE